MSNHTELIERLRTYRGGYDHERDCHGAANAIEQLEAGNERLRYELRGLHEAMQRDEALAIMASARETVFKLNEYVAALLSSTKLLRTIGPELADADFTRITHEQIAANEAALGGGK